MHRHMSLERPLSHTHTYIHTLYTHTLYTHDTTASLGFPEVMLGLLPGFGGTQRLPALIGVQNALPMLLTGSNKKGNQAKKMKLVDQVSFDTRHASFDTRLF